VSEDGKIAFLENQSVIMLFFFSLLLLGPVNIMRGCIKSPKLIREGHPVLPEARSGKSLSMD
jgi:hypothetical protein